MEKTRRRARPLAPEERREAIVAATRPLLHEHGRATTTRQIAEAAGIAEGTVFRAFASKEELFDAVLAAEIDPTGFLAAVAAIDPELPLRERMVAYVRLLQQRFGGIFALMAALGLRKPPAAVGDPEVRRRLTEGGLTALLADDADRFTLPVERVALLVRVLTFSGSHPHLADQERLSPEEIVDVVLHGVLRPGAGA